MTCYAIQLFKTEYLLWSGGGVMNSTGTSINVHS